MRPRTSALIALSLAFGSSSTAPAQEFTSTSTIPFVGYGLNDDGEIAGELFDGSYVRAHLWKNGIVENIAPPGNVHTYAIALNESRQVVINASQAGLWENGEVTWLGTLGGPNSFGSAIDESGRVCGTSERESSGSRAFLWESGVMTDLGTLGGLSSSAHDMDDEGRVVGSAQMEDGSSRATLWEGGVAMNLGTLPGGTSSHAYGIDNRRRVIGTSSIAGDSLPHAFVWEDGVMTDLGRLPNRSARAEDLNDLGWIVGGLYRAGDSEPVDGFVLTCGVMRNADAVVPAGSPKSFGVTAINEAGWMLTTSSQLLRPEAPICPAGNVNAGSLGCEPVDVVFLNGTAGGAARRVVVPSGTPLSLSVFPAPNLGTLFGQYALWIYDGESTGCETVRIKKGNGRVYSLGAAVRCLPPNNTVTPGSCPCPTTNFFGTGGGPHGIASSAFGPQAAAKLCVVAGSAKPRSPVTFTIQFPPGTFTITSVHRDRNSINSPGYNVSIGNALVVESRP